MHGMGRGGHIMRRGTSESEKIKLPIKRIISNNFFMLKLISRSSKTILFWTTFFGVVGAAIDFVFYTLILRFIINGVTNDMDFKTLVGVIIIAGVFNLIYFFFNHIYYSKYYNIQINNIQKGVHEVVFKKATAVELGCYENPEYYDKFVKALNECTYRIHEVINSVNQLFYKLFTFSANFTLLASIDPVLFLFVLIPLITIPMSAKINKYAVARTNETNVVNRHRDYSKRVFYLADYAKELRLTNMPKLLIERFREAGERNVVLLKKYGWGIAILNYIISILNEIVTALGATLYAAFSTIVKGTMTYGDCVIVFGSVASLSYTLTDAANTVIKFQENAMFIENLRRFLDYDEKIKSGAKPLFPSGDLILDNVTFKYEGASEPILKNISMKFGAKEKVAIVGHNGAGKTTLVKLLLRLYDADGKITYDGENIKNLKLDEYRDMFSAVMQDYHIFALTAADNVILRERAPEDINIITDSLKKAGIYDKISQFENGVDTVMTREFDKSGEVLSGGEQQKLSIAHVYSKENRFVILDEPSSALDPIAEYKMYERMNEACSDCGMIFISHRLSSAVMADRIYLIDSGEVKECGTHKELMELNGMYATMFRQQAENYREVE